MEISNTEPSKIRSGDSITWQKELTDYPASAWTLTYTLINSTHKVTITATNSSNKHLVTVSAITSAAYTAGFYDWVAAVSNGTDRYTVGTGRIEIQPNLSIATTFDTRSHARKMLEAIDAVLLTRATADQLDLLDMSIETRNIKRDPEKLLAMRDRFQAMVNSETAAEKIQNGLGISRKIQCRLVNR
jgi:hypothetical protein